MAKFEDFIRYLKEKYSDEDLVPLTPEKLGVVSRFGKGSIWVTYDMLRVGLLVKEKRGVGRITEEFKKSSADEIIERLKEYRLKAASAKPRLAKKGETDAAGTEAKPSTAAETPPEIVKEEKLNKLVIPPNLASSLSDVCFQFAEIQESLVRLKKENEILELLAAERQKEIERQKNIVDFLRREIERLKGETLQELAFRYPEHYKVLSQIAEKMKPRKEEKMSSGPLPSFLMRHGHTHEVVYEAAFLKTYHAISNEERNQVERALDLWSSEAGETHRSFNTKQRDQVLPGMPRDVWISRASDYWRFIWRKDKDGRYFMLALWNKEDSRFK